MFIYFHKNKFFGNNRGQLAPLFIVIIVVLIIMAFITVNLSKISSNKTESSNAVDAGAIAGGAVMANVFNAIASSNAEMEAAFWEFYATNMALLAIAEGLLLAGLAKINLSAATINADWAAFSNCDEVCWTQGKAWTAAAAEAMGKNLLTKLYSSAIMSIIISITAYSIAAYFNYQLIRGMAEKGRNSAMKMAYQFAFMNSGIGAKLKEGKPPADITGEDAKRNYRSEFSKVLDKFGDDNYTPPDEYTYAWKDGQNRFHSVKIAVNIEKVDTFKLKTTILPWGAEEALLMLGTNIMIAFLYSAGAALLAAACICYACKDIPYVGAACRVCWYALCYAGQGLLKVGLIANRYAIFQTTAAWKALLIAMAGLSPGPVIRDDSGDVLWATLCWIEDIVHDRKVQVEVVQHHEGIDTGIWQTNYPDTHSYSVVDFSGRGDIHPPELRYGADIVATDIVGSLTPPSAVKDCPDAVAKSKGMREEISSLLEAADEYDKQVADLDGIVAIYKEQGMKQADIDEMVARADEARARADNARKQAAVLEDQQNQLKADYAQCF